MANLKRCLLVMCLMVSMLTLVNVHLVHGQSIQYGKLTGKVLLPSGETLPGVAVVITSDALMTGKRTTVSTEKGVYVFLNLPVGKYKVSASLEGFKTVEQEDVTISAAGSVTLNLQMEIGTIEQKVTVTAVGSIVDVKTSTVDSKIDVQCRGCCGQKAKSCLPAGIPSMISRSPLREWLMWVRIHPGCPVQQPMADHPMKMSSWSMV